MIKRLFDVFMSMLAITIVSPLLFLLAGAIWCTMGSPILFRQTRSGLHGKPFKIYKFRTMKNSVAKDGAQLSDAERLTDFGKFLRSTSLDELPELWCILRGDMSFVGPRPLLLEYLPLYNVEQSRRLMVRPGLTGWAQVKGRNSLQWHEKFKLDVWYVDHQSFFLDLKIIALTFVKVLRREGISAEGDATMPKFRGDGLE